MPTYSPRGSRSYTNSRTGTSSRTTSSIRSSVTSSASSSKRSRRGFDFKKLDVKTIIIIVQAVLLVVLLIAQGGTGCAGCSPASCGSKASVDNVLTEFQYACNTLDIRAMLNCIDPDISDPIRLSIGLYGAINDTETDDLLESVSLAITGTDIAQIEEFYQSIEIEVLSIRASGRTATADTTIYFTLFGENIVRDAWFTMIEDHGKWYISSFSLDI